MPDDLTVVGFDDIAAAAWPIAALTTVRVDLDLLAETTVEMLLAEISPARGQTTGVPVERRIPVELRLRGTHGPARAS